MSSSALDLPFCRHLPDGAGLRHRGDLEGAALGADLDLLLEVADRLDGHLVVDLGVDQVVEDLLVGVGLLGLAGAHERELTAQLAATVATVAAITATAVVVVAACRGDEGEGAEHHRELSVPHLLLLLGWLRVTLRPRRCQCRLRGRRSAAGGCRPPARSVRPCCARVRGLRRARTLDRPRRACASTCSSASAPTSTASSRTSSVSGCGASTVKWTTTSEPSASRSSTTALMRRSGGASDTSDASSMSSGRMPSTIIWSTYPLRSGRARDDLRRDREPEAAELGAHRTVAAGEPGLEEVHRRRADEPGDEEVDGVLVERLRGVDLLQLALADHRDAVAHRHRLGLVVRDVDGGDAEVVLDPRDLGAHLHAELRVEVRQGLVHQERLRVAHDGPSHRDALALASRERGRLAAEQLVETEDARRLVARAR